LNSAILGKRASTFLQWQNDSMFDIYESNCSARRNEIRLLI